MPLPCQVDKVKIIDREKSGMRCRTLPSISLFLSQNKNGRQHANEKAALTSIFAYNIKNARNDLSLQATTLKTYAIVLWYSIGDIRFKLA